MIKEKTIKLDLIKPEYPIGKTIYMPQINAPLKTKIIAYNTQIHKIDGKNLGIVTGYVFEGGIFKRIGCGGAFISEAKDCDIYIDEEKAKRACRWLKVTANETEWKLAIGNREIEDDFSEANSPYSIKNCELKRCCGNISEARDILTYCKKYKGLIVHERNTLEELLAGHNLKFDDKGPMRKILNQLEIFKY